MRALCAGGSSRSTDGAVLRYLTPGRLLLLPSLRLLLILRHLTLLLLLMLRLFPLTLLLLPMLKLIREWCRCTLCH